MIRVGSALTHDLLLLVQVNNLLFDSGRLAGQEQVDDRIDIFLKANARSSSDVGQDDTFGTAFGNVLVLEGLCRGKAVILVKQVPLVDCSGLVSSESDKNQPCWAPAFTHWSKLHDCVT